MAMQNNFEALKRHKKKTITKYELEKLYSTTSDEELYSIIESFAEKGYLSPIKSSKTNGNRCYPIFLKYKVTLPSESYETELKEIAALHPMLQSNGYLQRNPMEYRKYHESIQKLDGYLFSHTLPLESISRKERSFEIFSEEKMFDDKTFCGVLEKIGLDANVLCFYDTPVSCFNDFIPEKKAKMTLLICENKDIWFNIRRRMFEDHATTIFGVHIDGVVYGCGNNISAKGALVSYTEFMVGTEVEYLYWGDIDRAGLNIFLSAVRNNPSISLHLFVPAYEEMLRLAQDRAIPDSEDAREIMDDYSSIYAMIDERLKTAFENSIHDNKRIPQEIISYTYLKNNMR